MCGSTKAPPVVKDDPIADQKKAQAKATQKSNAELATRRKTLGKNSLLTIGPEGTAPLIDTPTSLINPQQPTTPAQRPRMNPKFGYPGRTGQYLLNDTLGA